MSPETSGRTFGAGNLWDALNESFRAEAPGPLRKDHIHPQAVPSAVEVTDAEDQDGEKQKRHQGSRPDEVQRAVSAGPHVKGIHLVGGQDEGIAGADAHDECSQAGIGADLLGHLDGHRGTSSTTAPTLDTTRVRKVARAAKRA